ncbi:guanine nucleotide binding protein, alpha subunit, partial [Mycena sp. CBHHK59/15]
LWANSIIQEAIRASPRFQVDAASLEYIIDSLSCIADERYTPSDFNILLYRIPSPPEITETPFEVQVNDYLMVTRLRKWVHRFCDAESLIFVVNLTCYDQTIYSEETDKHLMSNFPANSISFHRPVIHTKPTQILLMNRLNLLAEKLARVLFTVCFPEYMGSNEALAAATYAIEWFSLLCSGSWHQIQGWCTNVLDTEQME